MGAFEIQFFNESPTPVIRAWRDTERAALDYAGQELKRRRGGVFNAAIWNSSPRAFFFLSVTARAEIFTTGDPLTLPRAQAERLRRRPIGEGETA